MPYVDADVIQKAKRVDLLSYLQKQEPQELVRVGNGVYCTKTHDSLKISNGKWMWWSRGIGGKSALDYLIKVRDMSFLNAVEAVMGCRVAGPIPAPDRTNAPQAKHLSLSQKFSTTFAVERYLRDRGIDPDILRDCIRTGIVYESLPYHNAVFVGLDEDGTPRYAAYRATRDRRIMGDCPGSDKRFSFHLPFHGGEEVHLFECAIDLLSYATLEKKAGRDYTSMNLLSLSGVCAPRGSAEITVPAALSDYLESHPETKRIALHFDNDAAGRNASYALRRVLSKTYEVLDAPPPHGKDFNDYLRFYYRERTKERDEARG